MSADYLSEVFGEGGLFARHFPGYEMREGQVALARMVDEAMRGGRHALGEGPCGCHVAGQGILMFDGSVKAVEDVVVGDRLMGPWGESRTVLGLARGQQETVEIRPIKGAPWRVNLDHILTLVRIDNGQIIDVCVRDWLHWPQAQKGLHRLFRTPIVRAPWREPTGALQTGFDAVPTGRVERYFGFSLDDDGRYLLDDFTVTHNTGKGVAYSVSAVWHAHHRKKRVVIATANIALQEQLVTKDLPLLAEVLPWSFTFALLKGRGNYLCRERMAESGAQGELRGLHVDDQQRQIDDVLAWAEATKTGDVSELPFIPLPKVWSRFSVDFEECKGDGCPSRENCFAERAKATAASADIVVTNYHLLFAHLAVRRETGQNLVLPAFDYLVLDEAHKAADIAREFFGFSIHEFLVARLARYAESRGRMQLAGELRREAADVFDAVARHARSPLYKARVKTPGFATAGKLVAALAELAKLAGPIADDETAEREDGAKARNARRQAKTLAAHLPEATGLTDPNKVYFIDLDAKGRATLGAKPIDVSGMLRAELFNRTESVTLVSATMTTAGTFDFIRSEVGAPNDAIELVAESPFDFENQALLVVPDGMPDPREPEFVDAVAKAVKTVIDACDGRTLGLFTSYRNLNAVYERVTGNGHRVLRQGDLPRTELTRLFKEDVGSVLLGTESFWTGIDVPGEALTGLVIDKLPFPHMDDPIVDAICERDRRAFDRYLVPRAIIMLRQGIGRLIRSQKDIGVAVILDPRIAEKAYGKRFLRSLPPMLTTRKLDNIRPFLAEACDASARAQHSRRVS